MKKMNRETCKGFLCGVLLSAAVMGLTGAAWAAGRTIQIEDGIKVTVNGVAFTPKDANGKEVPVFAYNGTTYVPIRAIGKAAGMTIAYDSSTRTAKLETPDFAVASDPKSGSYITAEKAKSLALADAGVAAADALILKASLDWEDGKAVYEVEFCAGNKEYDYELDAVTGKVLKKDFDCDDYDWNPQGGQQQAPSGVITRDRAKEIALTRLPGATVRKCELDYDDGRWEYELELWKGGQEYECTIDASTGKILKWEMDD